MSTSPKPRCSARERTQAQSLAAGMEYRRLQAADQALMRRLAREPLQYDTARDGDESEGEPEDDPPSDEEVKGKENIPPVSAWSRGTNSIKSAVCTAHPTVMLPQDRAHTELGHLRCFVADTFIDIFVTNTNACAQSLAATPPLVTDAVQMWRFIAARIRMGIVRLPETRMYWQADEQICVWAVWSAFVR